MAAEAKLTEAVSEAQAAVRAKADFLATMSHEIRTPMTGVLGMIELLRGGATPAEQNRYLEVLKNSANLLMTVLNDILDFSRLDGGKLHLEDVPFDLTEMVAMAVRLYGESATGKGLRLEFEPVQAEPGVRSPLGSIVVRGDPGRLQQALGNLISNAIKFTSAGSVRVRLSVARHPKGIRCELAVIDSGIGISQHDQEKLFAPFVQAEASTSRRFGGTGLGLTISRKVIEAMGGKLALRSQLGVGTIAEVVLTLPTATMPARAEGAVPAPEMVGADGEAIRPRRLDVLVAEDNPVNQMLLSAILRRQGHHPTCVGNGREAVAAAAARSYDCILMDMQMPEMDGPDATRAIRARGPNADTPIIAITADASPDRRAVYEEAGLTDFMTKPIDSAALGAKLTMIARPRRLAVVVGGAELRRIGGAKVEPPSNDGHATADARAPFDEVQLAQIREVLGDERLATLMRLFTSELEHRPAAIRSLAARGNLAGVQNQAHSLRGAASSIGGVLVGEAAALVERAAGTEQPLEPALKALDAAVAATLVAVERIAAEATTDRAVGA